MMNDLERSVETFYYEPQIKKKPRTDKRKHIAAYCRVSTLDEEQEISFNTQCRYYKRLIDADKTKVLVGIYGDQGISGLGTSKRKEFLRMMDDCRNGKIDVIITKSISRFSRNMSECVRTINELKGLGIYIVFEKEGIDTSNPNSELFLNILASLAQEESNNQSRNIRWAMNNRNANGHPVRRTCYGYRTVYEGKGKPRKWVVFGPEAKIVRKGFEMALQGRIYPEIRAAMNAMERARGSDKIWGQMRLHDMFFNEAYKGDILTNKGYVSDYIEKKMKRNRGERDQFYIENHHTPIIMPCDYDRVHEIIKSKLLKIRNARNRKKLLRTLDFKVTGNEAHTHVG